MFTSAHQTNLFLLVLSKLKIRHTNWFAKKYSEEHPYKDNLYGLSEMLTYYQIKNTGVQLDKEHVDFKAIHYPFIAYMEQSFAFVEHEKSNQIIYYIDGKRIKEDIDSFRPKWLGIALYIEKEDISIEPNYKEHRKEAFYRELKNRMLLVASLLLLFVGGIHNHECFHISSLCLLLLYGVAAYISYLLILKDIGIQNIQADKICSFFLKEKNCDDVLKSDAAEFLGISWSKIGFSFFATNIVFLLFFPSLSIYTVFANICALPYTVWSLWYQKFKLKSWCPLCICIQILIWVLFICSIYVYPIDLNYIPIKLLDIILYGAMYFFMLGIVSLMSEVYTTQKSNYQLRFKLNSFKSDEIVFTTLLKQNKPYDIDKTFGIFIGNKEAKNIVSIVTNPYCSPCALLHPHIESLLQKAGENLAVQLILFPFISKEIEESCRLFIHLSQTMDSNNYLSFLREWYTYSKKEKISYCKSYLSDLNTDILNQEIAKLKLWLQKTRIIATPTILFDGYLLPEKYQLKDLSFFTDINL